jgi:glycerophosphoryl diester phosphodiesterase
VRALSRIVPDRPVGLLSQLETPAVTGAQLVRTAQASNATFLGLNVGQTGDDVLQAAADAKLGVKVWTVDAPSDILRLASDPRVTTIISDRPDLALALRGTLHEAPLAATLQRVASTIR